MANYRGVQGGTVFGDPLCRTCRRAIYQQGISLSSLNLFCGSNGRRMQFEAYECTVYEDKRHAELYAMEQLAWIFKTDVKTREIGFVRLRDVFVDHPSQGQPPQPAPRGEGKHGDEA